jgi:hypothetical protein
MGAKFCGQCGFHLQGKEKVMSQRHIAELSLGPDLLDLTGSSGQGDTHQPGDPAALESPLMDLAPAEPATLSVERQEESDPDLPLVGIREVQALDAEALDAEALDAEALDAEDLFGAISGNLNVSSTLKDAQEPIFSAMATPAAGGPSEFPLSAQGQNLAQLLHVRTNTMVKLPQHLSIIHVGKPNRRLFPDVDVSDFPDSEVVSRVHANIRVEDHQYFLEDVGSVNGTYLNNLPVIPGQRHLLTHGDRIALGKEDKVAFLFQFSS